MGEADRFFDYRNNMRPGFAGSSVTNLLVVNVVFFIILFFMEIGFNANTGSKENSVKMWEWIAIPSVFPEFIRKPWTLFTYMFSHSGNYIMQLIGNLLWIWVFGALMNQQGFGRQVTPAYIYGGLLGGVFFLVASAVMPAYQNTLNYLFGANAAVMGMAVAAATLMPRLRMFQGIFGKGIQLWILLLIFAAIDVLNYKNNIPMLANLFGGALAGFVYAWFIGKGTDTGTWMHTLTEKLAGMYNTNPPPKKNIREHVFYNTGGRTPYTKKSHVTAGRVDEILDKINQKGFNSLTTEEKNILKRASEEGDT